MNLTENSPAGPCEDWRTGEKDQKNIGNRRLPLPIAILSFNRHGYLSAILQSLKPQLLPDDEVLLFQDGGWNPYVRHAKAPETEIDKCIEVFNSVFPCGSGTAEASSGRNRAFRHHINKGIALNYWMAETYVFDVLGRQYAVFLEDDLLLSPNYLSVISELIGFALENKSIGYVSAYGNLWASLDEQKKNENLFINMHENWGFGLTLKSWKAQSAIRNAYLSLVSGCDYRFRNQNAILEFYARLGYNCRYTTQDSSRWVACHAAGMVRLTTYTCHARYIGAAGEHSNPSRYRKYVFDRSTFFPTKPILHAPTEEDIAALLTADTENFRNGYEHDYVRRPSIAA